MRSPRAAWLLHALLCLPAAASLWLVGTFGVNVVVGDQWEMAALFRRHAAGTLTFWDLWQPHNEHRFVFPRLAMLGLGSVTAWNTVAEMYLFQACLALTLILLCLSFGGRVRARPLLLVPVALLVFSPRQWSNMLWGYQLTFALTLLFAVLALYCLRASVGSRLAGDKLPGWALFGAALVCAAVASGSSIQGLLVWPAGLLQLLVVSSGLRGRAWVVWVCAAVAVWVLYFAGYEARLGSQSSGIPLLNFLSQPVDSVGYALTLLGNSLLPAPYGGAVLGTVILVLAALTVGLILRSRSPHEYAYGLSLLVFALLVVLAVTVGRSTLGSESALASRYTTFSLLAVASVYAMLVEFWSARRSPLASGLLVVACALIMLSAPLAYRNAWAAATEQREARNQGAKVLATYDSRSDRELTALYRRPEVVRRNAPALERLDYNVFAHR